MSPLAKEEGSVRSRELDGIVVEGRGDVDDVSGIVAFFIFEVVFVGEESDSSEAKEEIMSRIWVETYRVRRVS